MTRADRFPPLAPPEPERSGNALGVFVIMLAVFAAGFCVGVLV